ncbi:MAG TPA: thioredoxin family protein [Rhodocyclaceae bacterium]|jgi:thiol:disulfide interchange protein DsbD|nr:thioredoxin family protein [Rhodocyclaceae bacterium]
MIAPTSPDFITAVCFALAGGLILNLMPCVFPVLSIKAIALLQHGAHADRNTRTQGWAYTAGVMLTFLGLATLLLLLRNGGREIGWGFQFQSPGFVLTLSWLMFAIGLSLSGVFDLGNSITGLGEHLTKHRGAIGSFFTGVLAVVVATPCTAPFMGAAIAYALAQPTLQFIGIFAGLGFGLALPYLLLSHWPLLQRLLPKPGAWMEKLKHFFAIPMYLTALWLLWVLTQQAGTHIWPVALGGLLAIAVAAILFGRTRHWGTGRRRMATAASLALLIGAATIAYAQISTQSIEHKESYSEAKLQALRNAGTPVFVNLTADWCITCLVNERVALNHASVKQAFRDEGVVYLVGDWTNEDAAITRKLAEFKRQGVPLYLYYPPHGEVRILPQILTPDILIETLKQQ